MNRKRIVWYISFMAILIAVFAVAVLAEEDGDHIVTDVSNSVQPVVNPVSDPVCKIDETEYGTLKEAFDAAETGAVIELVTDIDADQWGSEAITLDGKAVTLLGGGKTIFFSNALMRFTLKNGAQLTLGNDSGNKLTLDGCSSQSDAPEDAFIRLEGNSILNLYDGVVLQNRGKTKGQAIYAIKSAVNMYGGTITKISNTSKDAARGAIHLREGSEFNMHAGTISNCKNYYGGVFYMYSKAKLTIDGGTITKNVSAYGGVGYINNSCQITISKAQITSNGSGVGGVFYLVNLDNKEANINTVTFGENAKVTDNYATQRGGVISTYLGRSIIKTQNAQFSKNKSRSGDGGVFNIADGSVINAKNTTFNGNEAVKNGGVLCIKGCGDVQFEKCTFSFNSAENGGAAYLTDASLSMLNSTLDSNSAKGCGGAFYAIDSSTASVLEGCDILENTSKQGGAFYLSNAKVSAKGCVIEENNAQAGGAFYMEKASELSVQLLGDKETIIRKNATSSLGGGAVCMYNSSAELSNCGISANSSFTDGGAFCIDAEDHAEKEKTPSRLTMTEGAKISENTAKEFGGGVYLGGSATLDMQNGILCNNTAAAEGSAIAAGSDVYSAASASVKLSSAAGMGQNYQTSTHPIDGWYYDYADPEEYTDETVDAAGAMRWDVYTMETNKKLYDTLDSTGKSIQLVAAYWEEMYGVVYQYKNDISELPKGIPEPPQPAVYAPGDAVQVADAPEDPPIPFSGWTTDAEDVEIDEDGKFVMPKHHVLFTGEWDVRGNTAYVVEYYYQEAGKYPKIANKAIGRGGLIDSVVSVTDEDKIPDEEHEGYVLDEKKSILEGTISETEKLVLKVYFKQQFTVSFLPGEHGDFEAQVTENLDYNADMPAFVGTPTGEEGYSFVEWSPKVAVSVTENVEYTAIWSGVASIVYDANGGKGSMAETVGMDGETVKAEKCGFIYSGFTFVEWNTKKDGSGESYAPGEDIVLTAGKQTLYAQWKSNSSDTTPTPTTKITSTPTKKVTPTPTPTTKPTATKTPTPKPTKKASGGGKSSGGGGRSGGKKATATPTASPTPAPTAKVKAPGNPDSLPGVPTAKPDPRPRDAKQSYQLTVNFVYIEGGKAAEPVTQTLKEGTTYSVEAEKVSGYVPTASQVKGIMPGKDLEITIFYIKESAADKEYSLMRISDYAPPSGSGHIFRMTGESFD